MSKILQLLLSLSCIYQCFCSRILCICPTASVSHQVVFRKYVELLANRGHHITFVTTNPMKYNDTSFANITEIDIHDEAYEIWKKWINVMDMKRESNDAISIYPRYINTLVETVDMLLGLPMLQRILRKEFKYDLLVYEAFTPTLNALGEHLNIPMISMSTLSGSLNQYDDMGNPSNPILYRDVFSDVAEISTFYQRLQAVYGDLVYRHIHYNTGLWKFEEVAKKHFGPQSTPVGKNTPDMLFLSVSPIICGIRPFVPGIVHIDGLHLKPVKALPDYLQEYLDSSRNGVIYFSLGCNAKSMELPEKKRAVFLQAFAELPYDILWKWENDSLPNKPDNVHIVKWLPQNDILAHKKVRMFITQAGMQSTEESFKHGVPMLAIPLVADQKQNAANIVRLGAGLTIPFTSVTKKALVTSILKIMDNPKFTENTRRVSKLIYDQPMSSPQRAIWWTEYVIRHKGAKHLRSAMLDVPLYQYMMLDIAAFFAACLMLMGWIIVKVARKLILIYGNYKDKQLKKRQ